MHWLLLFLAASGPTADERADFDTDVLPLLAKAGCNAAACHGGASGRGGFKLSLFGGDPDADYDAIVRQFEGRRVNFARPADSLVIDKPSGLVDHGGGVRFEFDSPEAKLLARWIAAGTPREGTRRVERIAVEPAEIVLADGGGPARVRVVAHQSDGTTRDVTNLSLYLPGDEASVAAAGDGRLDILRPGRHTLVVRYLTHVAAVPITVPDATVRLNNPKYPSRNWIDDEISQTLRALAIPPGGDCGDIAYLRRVTLDLTGRLPTSEEVARFAADALPEKRARLADRLLASPEFVEYWTFRLAEWLRLRQAGDETSTAALHAWLRVQVKENTPLDRVARDLLLAEGDSRDGPPAFHLLTGDARLEAEQVSESLLGIRIRCANCHNHPLDRWTQDDYHGLAAIFARLERGRMVRYGERGEVIHPRTGRAAVPRLPGERFLPPGGDPRAELVAWMTRPEEPLLARATVNRIWRAMFGRGLIEPADDLRATNPATHPELLDRLTREFVEHRYDLRHIIRAIAHSATYAHASRPQRELDLADRFYRFAWTRPFEPEVFLDAIGDVTGVPERFGNLPHGTRAIALVHPAVPSRALDVLGRCSRTDGCESGPGSGGGLAAMLHRLNGPLVNDKLTDSAGHLARSIAAGDANEKIVADFYLRALGREPNAAERGLWKKRLASDDPAERRARLEDFVWSLLASEEFATNH